MENNGTKDHKNPLIRFSDVSFTWPAPTLEGDSAQTVNTTETPRGPVFNGFTAEIPEGFISLIGPNGSGKSTFMLLAGGRIMPTQGKIELAGYDTRVLSGIWSDATGTPGVGLTSEIEHRRNLVCSFLYQNMEFDNDDETSSVVGSLLEFVYINGGYHSKEESFFKDVVKTFELEHLRTRKLIALSKGEVQRVLLAFSALYGSSVIMMDEPVFAMEQYQKERALEFFYDMHLRTGISVLVSLHELSLTRKYADTVMLFYPDRRTDLGCCEEVLTSAALEDSYGVPSAMLYDSELLTRRSFLELDALQKQQSSN